LSIKKCLVISLPVILGLLLTVDCSVEIEPLPANFSEWPAKYEKSADFDKDSIPDIFQTSFLNAKPLESSDMIITLYLPEEEESGVAIWYHFFREAQPCTVKGDHFGHYLIYKLVCRSYIKTAGEYQFAHIKELERPPEVTEEIVSEIFPAETDIGQFYINLLIEAGLPEEKARERLPVWVWLPLKEPKQDKAEN